ncbi:hypothetical protein K2X33_12700 [bacterium]|nr:hypothetical protein [bacterium]
MAAGVLGFLGQHFSQPAKPTEKPRVLVLQEALPSGARLTLGDLGVAEGAQQGAVEARYLDRVDGRRLAHAMEAGAALKYSDLEWGDGLGSRVPAGKLAYPLEGQEGARLTEGDRLEFFSTPHQGGAARRLLSGVLVLDAGEGRGPLVALSAEEIAWVETAAQTGKLKIAIQSSRDTASGQRHFTGANRQQRSIEVWEEEL